MDTVDSALETLDVMLFKHGTFGFTTTLSCCESSFRIRVLSTFSDPIFAKFPKCYLCISPFDNVFKSHCVEIIHITIKWCPRSQNERKIMKSAKSGQIGTIRGDTSEILCHCHKLSAAFGRTTKNSGFSPFSPNFATVHIIPDKFCDQNILRVVSSRVKLFKLEM